MNPARDMRRDLLAHGWHEHKTQAGFWVGPEGVMFEGLGLAYRAMCSGMRMGVRRP